MNFDTKALRVVVLGDGSAFGATATTLTTGSHDGLVLENLSESSSSVPFAKMCICLADYAA